MRMLHKKQETNKQTREISKTNALAQALGAEESPSRPRKQCEPSSYN